MTLRSPATTDALSLVTMARVHLAFAELNEAGQSLYQAVKLDPRLAVAHLELGRLYEAERRMATAKRHYRVAFELQPDDPSVVLAWSRTVTDPAYRLNLLDKYLELAAGGGVDVRRTIESTAAALRSAGDNDKLQTYFLIDSGGFTALISKRTAEEAGGIRPSSTQLLGLSGEVEQVWNADPLVLNVLGLAQRYEGMLAIDLDEYGASGSLGIDGLLGFSFLEHSVLTLDDRNGLVRIEMGRVVRRPSRR